MNHLMHNLIYDLIVVLINDIQRCIHSVTYILNGIINFDSLCSFQIHIVEKLKINSFVPSMFKCLQRLHQYLYIQYV